MKKNNSKGSGRGNGSRTTNPKNPAGMFVLRDDGIREVIDTLPAGMSSAELDTILDIANTGHEVSELLEAVCPDKGGGDSIFAVAALSPVRLTPSASALLVLGIRRGESVRQPTETDLAELAQRFKMLG